MSSVFVRLSPGGAVSYKPTVVDVAHLPMLGNNIGDVRAVISDNTLYIWDGATWNAAGGGGGGGTPGAPSGSIQFNSGGTFAGDAELIWDNSGKILNLNGLAIHALSSTISLVNNQASPTTAFSYSASTYNFSIIEYSITRNTSKQVGILFIANDSSSATLTNEYADMNGDTGITFYANVSAGNVNVQYTSTNTGFNAFLRYSIRQWV